MDIDASSPPFDRLKHVRRLATERSGHRSIEHVRHHLYVGRDRESAADVLVKVASRPGLVYQQNLNNEIASLTAINRELPRSPHFPIALDHGRLSDGRVYLITYLFDEFPLATTIGAERMPGRIVAHLRIALATAKALGDLHRIHIVHVDLNPMNILHRSEQGRSVIRIVDFESSYEPSRHAGAFYDPPTTPGYSAPELAHQPPDARADVFSLGAVLYTMLAGYEWTWKGDVAAAVDLDRELDPELRTLVRGAVGLDPAERYGSMEQFAGGLSAYLERIWPGRTENGS
jgi:serine/threonine protein kinase